MPPSGGGSTNTVTQNSDPWSGVQPYLKQLLSSAGTMFTNTGLPGASGGNVPPSAPAQASSQSASPGGGLPAGYRESNGVVYGPNGPDYSINPVTGQRNNAPAPQAQPSGGGGNSGGPLYYNAQGQVVNGTPGYDPANFSKGLYYSDPNAQSVSSGPPSLLQSYFPGSTVASQSPQTMAAIQALTSQATSPQAQGLADAATGQITDTLNGAYLNPQNNPGFQQALTDTQKAYSTGTAAQTDAAFNNAGDYGGSAYQETKQNQNKAYADSLNTIAGQLYQQGRTNQLQAAQLAPGTNNIPYQNIGQLANAGSTLDAYHQNLLSDAVNRWNFNQQAPLSALSNFQHLIAGTGGGTVTQSQPVQGSSIGQGLGLGASILSGLNGGAGGLASLLGSGGGFMGAVDAAGSAGLPGLALFAA